jgi:tetratricopeptide (TPR) repeat protein
MSGRKDIFQRAMEQGHTAAWDQSWDKAAGFYRQALEEFPEHPQALTSLGLALFELQDYENSLRCYITAVKGAPDDPVPVEKISQIYEQMGNLERARAASLQAAELQLKNRDIGKAIENWIRVTHFQPDNLTAHLRLALVYERMGKTDEAVNEYLFLAAIFQRANDLGKAMRAAQHALELKPGNNRTVTALTMLKEFKPLPLPGRPSRKTGALRHVKPRQTEVAQEGRFEQNLDPVAEARQKALSTLAGMLFEVPNEEKASRRGFESIVRGKGDQRSRPVDYTRIVLHLGQVIEMQMQGDMAQAAVELDRAMDAGLEHPAAYFDLGYLRFHTQDLESATRHLQVAMQHPDFSLGARLTLGQIYQSKGELRQAAVEFLEALRQADAASVSPEQADVLDQLYEPLVEAQNQADDAQVQQQLCDNISGLLLRAEWRDHLQQARKQLPAQIEGGPPVPLAEVLTQARSSQIVESLNTIYQLERAGKLRSAMEEAFFALQYAPTYLHLHVIIAELLLKQGQVKEAIDKFLAVAQSYTSRGEARRAISMYRRVIEQDPVEMNPRMRLIELLTSVGRQEEALNEFMELAEVHYSMADRDKARKAYVDALRIAQQSAVDRSWQVRILHRLADLDLRILDWREALRSFDQIRNLDPSDDDTRTQLVQINFRLGQEARGLAELDNYLDYLESRGQRDKALNVLENWVREEPKRVGLFQRLAGRYQQAGRTGEAVSQLDAAGELLVESGDINGAIQVVEMILSLRPKNAADYQKLLAQLKGRVGVR